MESDIQGLQIDAIEGLQTFWGYVNDVYAELQTLHLSGEEEDRAENIYDALKRLIENNLNLKEHGGHVSEEDSKLIQAGYDELISFIERRESLTTPTLQPIVNSVQTTHSSPTAQTSQLLYRDDTLLEESKRVSHRANSLLEAYKSATNNITSSEGSMLVKQYLHQLQISKRRAHAAEAQLTEKLTYGKPVLSDLVKEHYQDVLEEINENLDQLTSGLSLLLTPTKGTSSQQTAPTTQRASSETSSSKKDAAPRGMLQTLIALPKNDRTKVIHHSTQKPVVNKIERPAQSPLTKHIETVLSIQRYSTLVAAKIGSPIQAEAMIRREVHQIEAPSKFEAIFGFSYANAFYTPLLDMTARDISEFDSQPRDIIRAILTEKNIKYEMYLDWIDLLIPILELTRAHADLPFAELFIRAHFELMLRDGSAST